MLHRVFDAFGIHEDVSSAVPFGSGLINHTWKVMHNDKAYILQRINHQVFKNPHAIAHNITVTGEYLQTHYPGYPFVLPVKSIVNDDIYFDAEHGYFRLLPFIENSHTVDVVNTIDEAFEAAKAFGGFTKKLCGFDCTQLQITLPDFHNLSLRYSQFEEAALNGNKERIEQAADLIDFLHQHKSIVTVFEQLKTATQFKLRVAHHDTKISNVLFDDSNKGICVIDLDTLMPGYFISDVGDMLRTYVSPVSEEEKDFSKICIREEYFASIIQGYLGEMNNELTELEKQHFVYAGKFMIYMQALRFLTDHLNNDIYYGARYEGHNFIRAKNQIVLLQKLMEKEHKLQEMATHFSNSRLQIYSN
jgi:Ser/Thr protein kinase RdoA (MazF antagonist)